MLECLMAMLLYQWDVGHSLVNQPRDKWRVLLWIEGIFNSKFDFCVALLDRRGVHNSQPTPFLRMGPMGPSKKPEWSSPLGF